MIVGIDNNKVTEAEKSFSRGAYLASQKDRIICEDKRAGTKLRMGELLEGLPDGIVRSQTAVMINNMREFFDGLSETTKLVNVGDFEKFSFPMVRAVFPNLGAHNWASVQPMMGPVSLVFFMKFIYGLTKGSAVAGTDIIENPNRFYASEEIDEELQAVGDGITATLGSGNLDYLPVKPGTVVLTTLIAAVAAEITDDGNGNLVGDIGAASTINYVTGLITVTWVAAPDLAADINAAYSYDMEANDTVPDLDMQLTSSPVVAKTRKLRTRWSLEADQDLRTLHGLEAEVEQLAGVSNELKFEIDQEILHAIAAIAVNTVTAWSKTPGAGISYAEHKLGFVDKLIEASNAIFQATQRAVGTWIVAGTNVCSLIETLPGFVAKPRPVGTRGVYNTGTLNGQWDVWKDPNYGTNSYLMGYRGESMWEVGYIFAPYLLAVPTATVMLDDFMGRKGIASRYGKKSVEGKFYCTGTITA